MDSKEYNSFDYETNVFLQNATLFIVGAEARLNLKYINILVNE